MRTRIIIVACLAAVCGLVLAQTEWDFGIGQKDQVTKGLVSYWAMRNSGTTVFDEWGANHGGASNGVTFGTSYAAVASGANFASNDSEYINMGYIAALDFATNQPFSVSIWVKHSTSNFTAWVGNAQDETNPRKGWSLSGGGSSIGVRFVFSGSTNDTHGIILDDPVVPVTNTWTHYAFSYTGSAVASGVSLYRNAVVVSPTVTRDTISGPSTSSTPVEIGRRAHTTSRLYHNGNLDEIRVYNRALTADEIKQLYRMGAIPKGIK
jgi:hypothetical protein